MAPDWSGDVTRLLAAMKNGDAGASEQLYPLVYDALRGLAAASLRAERPGHTLGPTALVHEAYLKLVGQNSGGWNDRSQFLGVAAQAMRRILIDHARKRHADKRGGVTSRRLPIDEVVETLEASSENLPALDDALSRLAALDPQKAKIVELRFFGGLGVAEAAEVMGLSRRTLERDWTLARAWLRGEIRKGDA